MELRTAFDGAKSMYVCTDVFTYMLRSDPSHPSFVDSFFVEDNFLVEKCPTIIMVYNKIYHYITPKKGLEMLCG
jgi:hypothetical protein